MTFRSSVELWELTPDGFLLIDRHGAVRAFNPALASMFGAEPGSDSFIGRPVEDLLPVDLRADHVDLRTAYFDAPEPRSMGSTRELVARDLHGTVFPVEVSLTPVPIEGETMVIAAVRDLSERQRNRRSLEDANRRLARAEDNERIATAFHDNVVQQLFVLGLELDQLRGIVDDEHVADRIDETVDTIDDIIRRIRNSIAELTSPRPPSISLRDHVTEIAAQLASRHGIRPDLSFTGDVDRIELADIETPVHLVLGRTVDLLVTDSAGGTLSIRLDARESLVIEVNASGAGRPSHLLVDELTKLCAADDPAAFELAHDDGNTKVQWTMALPA